MNVAEWMPLVKQIAGRLIARLPANVERDDLVQAGSIGLLDAMARFDDSQGNAFAAFATPRIHGAMLDELRSSDHMPRAHRERRRRATAAETRLQQRLGRSPTRGEVAAEAGLTLDELHALPHALLVPLDDDEDKDEAASVEGDDDDDPAAAFQRAQRLWALAVQVERLPERERYVVQMHHEHDISLTDVATALGVTVTRACQIHASAVARLRLRLSAY